MITEDCRSPFYFNHLFFILLMIATLLSPHLIMDKRNRNVMYNHITYFLNVIE